MKTFKEFLAEAEDEFRYHVTSVVNVHTEEMMSLIHLALAQYGVKAVERGAYKMPGSGELRDFPNAASWTVIVVTSHPIDTRAGAIEVTNYTRIPTTNLLFHEAGVDPYAEPKKEKEKEYVPLTGTVPEDKEGGQKFVGDARLSDFLKELGDDRNEREAELKKHEREVYEAFVTTHLTVESMLDAPLRKGYYIIQNLRESTGENIVEIRGPFMNRGEEFGIPYRDNYAIKGKVVESISATENGLTIMELVVHGAADHYKPMGKLVEPAPKQQFKVAVRDQDTGREFRFVVDAGSIAAARERAKTMVTKNWGILPDRLLVLEPHVSHVVRPKGTEA